MVPQVRYVEQRLLVANSAWTGGTVEWTVQEVIRTVQATINERRQLPSERIVEFQSMQWALIAAHQQLLCHHYSSLDRQVPD